MDHARLLSSHYQLLQILNVLQARFGPDNVFSLFITTYSVFKESPPCDVEGKCLPETFGKIAADSCFTSSQILHCLGTRCMDHGDQPRRFVAKYTVNGKLLEARDLRAYARSRSLSEEGRDARNEDASPLQ